MKDLVIHTPTPEVWDKIIKTLEEKYPFLAGRLNEKDRETAFGYKEQTCISVSSDYLTLRQYRCLCFSELSYCRQQGDTIFAVDQIDKFFEALAAILPVEETLILNSEHEAIITKDGVKVGCQTFALETVLKLAEIVKRVQKS